MVKMGTYIYRKCLDKIIESKGVNLFNVNAWISQDLLLCALKYGLKFK